MAPPTPRSQPELVWPLEPIPDGLDRQLLLDNVLQAFAEMIHYDLLPESLPAIATVHIALSPVPLPPGAWLVRLSIHDAAGATLSTCQATADVEALPIAANHLALQFARLEHDEANGGWQTLVVSGSTRAAPRKRPRDAPSAAALAAATADPPVDLCAHAGGLLASGERTGDVDHFLHAADLFELVGDLAAARDALMRLEARGAPEAIRGAVLRGVGLAAHEHLGRELVAMLLWSGRAIGTTEHPEPFPSPLAPELVLGATSVALATHGCDFIHPYDGAREPTDPAVYFGRYLGAVWVAALELDVEIPVATPWLRTLAPADVEPTPPKAALVAAALEHTGSMVRWELWQQLVPLQREALDALVGAHPDFGEAHARRALVAMAGGVEAVVAVVDPALAIVETPSLRAMLLTARGGVRTDALQLAEGLADLDAAAALEPGSRMALRCRALNLNLQGRTDEALAMIDRAATLYPPYPHAHRLRGRFLSVAKRYEEALPHLYLAIEHTPDDPEAWWQLGSCLRQLKKLDEAVEVLFHAVEMAPALPAARFHRGLLFADLCRTDEARADLEWITATLPPDAPMAIDAKERLARLDTEVAPQTPDGTGASRSWASRLDPWVILFGVMLVMLLFRVACARSP